jgi:hypothetical protein
LEPRDRPTTACVDAVIYDLDSFPSPMREGVLAGLCAESDGPAFAVHSYNLEDDQIEQLTGKGVIVARCLSEEFFSDVRYAVGEAAARKVGLGAFDAWEDSSEEISFVS